MTDVHRVLDLDSGQQILLLAAQIHPKFRCKDGSKRELRTLAGDLSAKHAIVCLLHWGEEYVFLSPLPVQRNLGCRLARLGVDLIVGSHPHVVQGDRKVRI